jgi:hypothetical protein
MKKNKLAEKKEEERKEKKKKGKKKKKIYNLRIRSGTRTSIERIEIKLKKK